jgi:hypothetical protein
MYIYIVFILSLLYKKLCGLVLVYSVIYYKFKFCLSNQQLGWLNRYASKLQLFIFHLRYCILSIT